MTDSGTQRLAALFEDGEWRSDRVWLRRRRERTSFFSANIILILERCGVEDPVLRQQIAEAREHMLRYRVGHRFHYWPVTDGRSHMHDAPAGWARPFQLSPDADSTTIAYLTRPEPAMHAPLIADLMHYRVDGENFVLPEIQQHLPSVHGSFLTWFPEPERCHPGKLETVDVGVDANILWYLAANNALGTPGTKETIAFVSETLLQGLLFTDSFRVSSSYPKPALLLYLIARAAVWGPVPELMALRDELVAQLQRCPAPNAMEQLCRLAALRLLGAEDARGESLPMPDGLGVFYVGPLLSWPMQRMPFFLPLAASPASQMRFHCEALEWALRLSLQT